LNAKLQASQGLDAQDSRLVIIKRRAYLVACLVGLFGIAIGFLATPDLIRRILYFALFISTFTSAVMVVRNASIQRIEHFGFSYSAAFIVLRGAHSLYIAQNEVAIGAALTETYTAVTYLALLSYILLDTRTALRASIAAVGSVLILGLIKIVATLGQGKHPGLLVVLSNAFTNAATFLAFSYVLALTKDLLAVEQIRSSTDPLTGAANRWQMYNLLEREWQISKTQKRTFSVILLDIDYFKRINDAHGHNAGDEVLQEVARVLKKTTGNLGCVGRWGGEEFLILLPHATLEQARVQAETLRDTLANRKLRVGQVTASFGVASLLSSETTTDLMRRADEALYNAKLSGRNRVEIKPRAIQLIEPLEVDFIDPRATSHS
jgi:diguanylate cyclase (GGDEF)-like protein